MMVNYERAVYQMDVEPHYGFIDDPEWGVDISREDCLFLLNVMDETGYHACWHSAVWEDVSNLVDGLQEEVALPDGKYIVTYYWYDGNDLLQLVDVGVTKAQIIQNVLDQKYKEGADYFLMEEE